MTPATSSPICTPCPPLPARRRCTRCRFRSARGAYLVNGPGHCAECHSPRNILGGIESGKRFAGGPDLEGKGWVPNITQKGLATYSEKDIAYLLETGQTLDGDSVGGPMAEVIRNTSQLPAADREAMAVYLKSLPPVEGPPRPQKK